MHTFSTNHSSTNKSTRKRAIFIFMGSHTFRSALYETVDITFIRNLFEYRLVDHSDILVTSIFPKRIPEEKYREITEKEDNLRKLAQNNGIEIQFYHIKSRTIKDVINASKDINRIATNYDDRFIWAMNYFNCFIGVLIKKQNQETHLHFDIRGLVPEEELFYSKSNILFRLVKFMILRIMGRINIKNADSISVVSRRFKEYIVKKYNLISQKVVTIPCFFDQNQFYFDETLRLKFRNKYHIADHQKLIFYSGTLLKWQEPDLLFSFIKNLQIQDNHQELRFMILTLNQEKARQYMLKYNIKDLIIESASGQTLTGLYSAADIGIAVRSDNLVSYFSSPVKIPEYLGTQNCLILLECIGDFGLDLKNKKYALIKKDKKDLLTTNI